MSFCTAVNCIDGRTQLPVITYLTKRFGVLYVDMVTEPGPILILSEQTDTGLVDSILDRVRLTIERHNCTQLGVVSHWDCAANPVDRQTQETQLRKSIGFLQTRFPQLEIIGLWVDKEQNVTEVVTQIKKSPPSRHYFF